MSADAAWRREGERQEALSGLMVPDEPPQTAGAMERVWLRLGSSTRARPSSVGFWSRRLALPMPMVAAAVCLLLVLAFALVYAAGRGSVGRMQITTAPSGIRQVQVEAPIQELEALLRSLDNGSGSRELVIQLPQESQFFVLGEPILIREADLRRSHFR